MSIRAGSVMDRSASLLNDTAKSSFTYAAQVPYLNMAIDDLLEEMESNNVPSTNEVSSIFVITTAMTDIGGPTGPALPPDLVEIQGVYERSSGLSEDFRLMSKVDFLPPFAQLVSDLIYWSWQNQEVRFLGATSVRDVRINYIGAIFSQIKDQNDVINVINARSYLSYRTAALCAEFIGENKTRADSLNGDAERALYKFLNLNTKGRQSIATRRRPFMAGYRMRSGF